MAAWLIAHQGGWDEILLFVAPVLLVIGAIRWAERRNRSRAAGRADAASVTTDGERDQE